MRKILGASVPAAAFAAGLAGLALARPPAPGQEKPGDCPVTFTDVAEQAGLKFRHDKGATKERRLAETMGSGLAWLDYDNDGWMDLYVVQSGPFPPSSASGGRAQDRLYRNNGDGTFTEVTAKAKLKDNAYGMGAVAADYDNDGFTDLYVTNYGKNILYHNNGDGTFTDVTDKAGVGLNTWSTSAAFADFDGDGYLDLIVLRYVDDSGEKDLFCGDRATGVRDYCSPKLFPPTHDYLFHNNRDGTFTDITASAGLDKALGKGLGVVVADVDDDGKPDIYIANDTTMNFLFHNLGGNKFEDISLLSGAAMASAGTPYGGMGVNAGDLTGSGRMDLVVANFEAELNSLFRNVGQGVFEDATGKTGFGGPSFPFSGFGLNLLDAANAGRLDAFIANGHVLEHPTLKGSTAAQRPFLMWNDGKGKFHEKGCGAPFSRELIGRGSAVADYDNDGDVDIAVSNSGQPLELLRNDGTHGNWIGFVLRGTKSNRQGIGARVTIETESGRQVREVKAGESYLASCDPRVHFGLGAAAVRKITIRWPSGIVQEVTNARPGKYNPVTESSAN
ncbi:MAG TPA: CRTAC1 family protein [Thermoanaerobaculia bacterium]|nr:CRTAC1 family protein [Thermoanaerobaculia bacterium]